MVNFNPGGLVCDPLYCGTVTASACTANNGLYSVTGCTPCVCTRPTNVAYDFSGESAAHCLKATGTSATCAASLSCEGDYKGTPAVTLCTTAGPYAVSGCTPKVCTRPTTAGYDFSSVTETSLNIFNF